MKTVRLLLLLVVGACNSPRPAIPVSWQYKEFLRIDSLARLYPDSAFYYYYQASENLTDSSYKGTFLQRMAEIQLRAGDYYGSNETALSSLKLFDQKNTKHYPNVSYNYNLLATNCLELGRYDDALRYYDLAFRYSDSSNIPYYMNNKGVTYQKKKLYNQAIILYDSVLKNPIQDTVIYTRLLSNLAKARWLKDPGYHAADMLHEARNIRELKNDRWGLNASYSHLADYYTESNPDSARQYAEKMYKVAKDLNSADDEAEALEKLVRLSAESSTKNYFALYDSLIDSIRLARSNAKNQFADIRFAAEEAREENFLLEKDNSQKKLKITRQQVIIYSTLTLFIVFSTLGIMWYKRRKRFQELQTRNAIRESELKTSQKVHDVVANGLYRIMNELEHKENIEKEPLLDKIETLYEQSRDLSYDAPTLSPINFHESLQAILISFATAESKVITVGNNEEMWKGVSPGVKKELEYVLQELMVNMRKHSAAQNVAIHFVRNGKKLFIRYTDDGMGLPADYQQRNGITNTGNRIRGIGGSISFEKNSGKGLRVEITVPITNAE